jgi:hypothetical protein
MKEQEMAIRHMGIDPGKRRMEARILEGKEIERQGLTTDEKGRHMLCPFVAGFLPWASEDALD